MLRPIARTAFCLPARGRLRSTPPWLPPGRTGRLALTEEGSSVCSLPRTLKSVTAAAGDFLAVFVGLANGIGTAAGVPAGSGFSRKTSAGYTLRATRLLILRYRPPVIRTN